MTSILIQLALVITLFSQDAFTFTLKLCSSLSLIPYLLAAAYALKLGAGGETYDARPQSRSRELFVAGLATFYTVFLIFAAGLDFALLSLSSTRQARSCSSCPGASRTGVPFPGRNSSSWPSPSLERWPALSAWRRARSLSREISRGHC
jgi:amino acid transporter